MLSPFLESLPTVPRDPIARLSLDVSPRLMVVCSQEPWPVSSLFQYWSPSEKLDAITPSGGCIKKVSAFYFLCLFFLLYSFLLGFFPFFISSSSSITSSEVDPALWFSIDTLVPSVYLDEAYSFLSVYYLLPAFTTDFFTYFLLVILFAFEIKDCRINFLLDPLRSLNRYVRETLMDFYYYWVILFSLTLLVPLLVFPLPYIFASPLFPGIVVAALYPVVVLYYALR